MKEDKALLKLEKVKFANFGTRTCPPRKYLSIDLFSNWTSMDKITKWLRANNIDEPVSCVPRRKLYGDEFMLKYRFGLDRHTKIVDSNGKRLPKKNLNEDSDIDIVVRIYPGTYWRGLGVKRLVEKIVVHDNSSKKLNGKTS